MKHEDIFKHYNYLGFNNPYYSLNESSKIELFRTFSEAVNWQTGNLAIDVPGLIEIVNKGFLFGDRTLIKGIKRAPWLARPKPDLGSWEVFEMPVFTRKIVDSTENIARSFFKLLKKEILEYIEGSKNIGILLTGGMDSRIVACVLDYLLTNHNKSVNVLAITWGLTESRDVQYASRIATLLGWDWRHFEVTEETMLKNIQNVAETGCEFSPLHLHAMLDVAEIKGIDCVLAGSFGDGIGRGEYSGRHVLELAPLENISNKRAFFYKDIYQEEMSNVKDDLLNYRKRLKLNSLVQLYEYEQQIHYMRRMLNPCMSVIRNKIPLYQVFSSPEVVSYIWSLDPSVRNDDIYAYLLRIYNNKLLEIPWARTGLRYPLKKGVPDKYLKNHHHYGILIREKILPALQHEIFSGAIEDLNVFDLNQVKTLIKRTSRIPIDGSHGYEALFIWLISLSRMLGNYNLQGSVGNQKADNQERMKEWVYYYGKFLKFNVFNR